MAGRPFAVETPEDFREEVTALRAEMREMADQITPISAYLWRRGAIDPTAKAAAGRLVHIARRAHRRYDDGGNAA